MSQTTGIYKSNHTCINISSSKKNLSFQFAYHKVTFFLIRLFRQFTGFTLEQSENLLTPVEWAACEGLKGTEKVVPTSHLTMYIKVGLFLIQQDQDPCDGLSYVYRVVLDMDGASQVFKGISLDLE